MGRQRSFKNKGIALLVGVAAALVLFQRLGFSLPTTQKPSANTTSPASESSSVVAPDTSVSAYEKATVKYVVDGDTLCLDLSGAETRVRLIGVDTPEIVAPDEYYKENTEAGKKVSDIVKGKIKEGDTLYLEFDVEHEDKYGRTLAYVYFSDGTMVQEWLLKNGYAEPMTVQPNIKYKSYFENIANEYANLDTLTKE